MTKPHGPASYHFVARFDPALREKLFHIAEAQREAKVESYCVANDNRREAVPFERYTAHEPTLLSGGKIRRGSKASIRLTAPPRSLAESSLLQLSDIEGLKPRLSGPLRTGVATQLRLVFSNLVHVRHPALPGYVS